jgi:hypothetical protein
MVSIFRIGEKVDNVATHIAIEFQLLNSDRDYKILQKIVRGVLSEYGVESTFGIDESGKEFSVFDYETMMPYMILYSAPHDNSQSSIKLMNPNVSSIKDYKDMLVNKGMPI